jgi:hypothetical protein
VGSERDGRASVFLVLSVVGGDCDVCCCAHCGVAAVASNGGHGAPKRAHANDYRKRARIKVSTHSPTHAYPISTNSSFNNFCLKYVDASFYQVARGLVLPFTVITSLLFLRAAPPSKRILLACAIVTGGFFTGVFLDHVTATGLASKDVSKAGSGPSALGVFFGILSSASTALQAVVIKRALDVVDGSAIDLAWYTNLLSAVGTIPIIVIAGEVPAVLRLLFGPDGTAASTTSALGTFLWGTAVTVSSAPRFGRVDQGLMRWI